MKRSSLIALVVAVAVVGGAGGFFGGMSYGKGRPSAQAAMSTRANLTADQRSNLGGGRFPGGAPGDGTGAAAGAADSPAAVSWAKTAPRSPSS